MKKNLCIFLVTLTLIPINKIIAKDIQVINNTNIDKNVCFMTSSENEYKINDDDCLKVESRTTKTKQLGTSEEYVLYDKNNGEINFYYESYNMGSYDVAVISQEQIDNLYKPKINIIDGETNIIELMETIKIKKLK